MHFSDIPTAAAVTSPIHGMLGETHTLVCKITNPGNPEWLYFWWTHESGMDLSGHASHGNLTLKFDSLCLTGEFSCFPVNAVGLGKPSIFEVMLNGKKMLVLQITKRYRGRDNALQGNCRKLN